MSEKRYIILTRGIQASGKSTWAENWVKEKPNKRIRINWDSLRNMFGEYWVLERENTSIIKDITNTFFNSSMEYGFDIVMDNMNLNPNGWKSIKNRINEYNSSHTEYQYELQFKDFFNVTLEECIRRDSMRSIPIGEKVIRSTYRKYRNFIATELNKQYVDNLVPIDNTKKNCIVVDMDATLCFNLQGRPFYGEEAADTMKDDFPYKNTIDIVNKYINDNNTDVIILTGREDTEKIRTATETWLKNNLNGSVDKVLMRPDGNHIKGEDCKKYIYETYIKPYYNIIFVLEDSYKVVKMWRNLGITCLQVNDGTM